MRLSIVIPVYNELSTIGEIMQRVLDVPIGMSKELIIVDDCSVDGTRAYLQTLASHQQPDGNTIKLFFHDKNQGKGAAIRTGLSHVSGEIVLIQDADLEYDPTDYPALLKPILDGRADVVF